MRAKELHSIRLNHEYPEGTSYDSFLADAKKIGAKTISVGVSESFKPDRSEENRTHAGRHQTGYQAIEIVYHTNNGHGAISYRETILKLPGYREQFVSGSYGSSLLPTMYALRTYATIIDRAKDASKAGIEIKDKLQDNVRARYLEEILLRRTKPVKKGAVENY